MRLLLTFVLAAATISASTAQADIMPGESQDFGIYSVSASAATQVGTTTAGNPLLAVTLTLTNISGNSNQDLNGIGNVVIGSNGSLHHEQAPNAVPVFAVATPLANSFTDLGQPTSPVDSYLIQPVGLTLPGGDPTETFSNVASGVPVEVLDDVPLPTAATGFGGVLTASYSFNGTANSFDVAYLVFEDLGVDTAVDFTFRPTNAAGVSEDVFGRVVLIPEPSTALLGVLALVGFAARRR